MVATHMITFMQLKVARAKRRTLTQAQKAQIVNIEVARKAVRQMIEKALATKKPAKLSEEDLDHIFNGQPVHFDDLGYVPHWFERQFIHQWAMEIWRYRNERGRKAEEARR